MTSQQHDVTEAELAELERRWRKAMEHPGRMRLLTPLPRRVRLKLALGRARTQALIAWLKITRRW